MRKDLWHFPRKALAEQVMQMFDIGLSSALTFFAPRRMGKTEFLRKDVLPNAQNNKWNVHYFSFLDVGSQAQTLYANALLEFALEVGALKSHADWVSRITKFGGQAGLFKAEVALSPKEETDFNIQMLIKILGAHKKTILLLDEVQILSNNPANEQFLASLRTALDTNKETIKTIFTGSSQEGLRRMFSQAKAPFFHFGQNLDLPDLDQAFTDHLSDVYHRATQRKLDKKVLWEAFQSMGHVPQLVRSLVERLALNPDLSIQEAQDYLLADLHNHRSYVEIWSLLSRLEQLLVSEIAQGGESLFGKATREKLALGLGVETLNVSSVQSALRVLERKGLIVKSMVEQKYVLEDPNFKIWVEKQ